MYHYNIKTIYEWPVLSRLAIFLVLFLLICILGYSFDVRSINSEFKRAKLEERDLLTQYGMVVAKQASLTAEVSQVPSLAKTLEEWKKSLVPQAELPELLNEILKVGNASGLFYALFNPEQSVQAKFYNKLPIKIIVVGSYHQLARFVSDMANLPWLVVIDGMQLSEDNRNDVLGAKLAEQANAQDLLTSYLTVNIYYTDGNNGERLNE